MDFIENEIKKIAGMSIGISMESVREQLRLFNNGVKIPKLEK